ncbi:MAG TPA: hypothetical protein VGD78_12355 [Chthoniobacterales bacterium]
MAGFRIIGSLFLGLLLSLPSEGADHQAKRTTSGQAHHAKGKSAHGTVSGHGAPAGHRHEHFRSRGRKSGRHHRVVPHHAATHDQGPVREQTLEEIFPPGHQFTVEERAEASAIGAYLQNGLWKDAYKASTKASRQHPDRWWLHAARAAAAANLSRSKDTIDAVDQALQTNRGDANRLNLSELYVLKGNALSRLNRKGEAINTFLAGARVNPKDPYSRAGAAWLYATAEDQQVRNGAKALGIASEAAKLTGQKDATVLDVLAASYAETGNFAAARRWEEKAIRAGDPADLPFYQRRLQNYQANLPWRERL